MPVLQTFDFDTPATSLMNENAGNSQLLQVTLNAKMRKLVTDIQCGYNRQLNIGGVPATAQDALANTFVQGRVIVVTGRIDLSGQPILSLLAAMSPIQAVIDRTVIPYSRILFDELFVNALNVSLTTPKEVTSGEDVHVIMSQGYAISDTGLAVSSVKVGTLNVGGYYDSEATRKIPWRLR